MSTSQSYDININGRELTSEETETLIHNLGFWDNFFKWNVTLGQLGLINDEVGQEVVAGAAEKHLLLTRLFTTKPEFFSLRYGKRDFSNTTVKMLIVNLNRFTIYSTPLISSEIQLLIDELQGSSFNKKKARLKDLGFEYNSITKKVTVGDDKQAHLVLTRLIATKPEVFYVIKGYPLFNITRVETLIIKLKTLKASTSI